MLDMIPSDFPINVPLLQFVAYLGMKYSAREVSGGRDEKGNLAPEVGGHPNSWHLWRRGANARDLKPMDPTNLPLMEREARAHGYHVKVYKRSIHIEVPW